MFDLFLRAFLETLVMVVLSSLIGMVLGGPIGIRLFNTGLGGLSERAWEYRIWNLLVNSFRSIPYIILTILMIPFTRMIVGSSIGTLSAVIPLSFSATLLVARVVEDSLRNVPKGLIEAGLSMGATRWQITRKILFSECLPLLVSGITMIVVNLTGFSAMAGAVGGGGLGDLAIRYGYQRFDFRVLSFVVVILILWVQGIQISGHQLALRLKK